MSFTQEEATQIKVDIEVLKQSSAQVVTAIAESVEQTKENNSLINSLIHKMDEHDLRREYEEKEREEEKKFVRHLELRIDEVNARIDGFMPVITESAKVQERKKKRMETFDQTWVKLLAGLVFAAICAFIGIEITKV